MTDRPSRPGRRRAERQPATAADSRGLALLEEQLEDKGPALREIVAAVRALVKEVVADAEGPVSRWGMPTYDLHGDLYFIMVARRHVSFGFYRGTSLEDPHGLLEGAGTDLRHVKLRKMDDLKRDGLRALVEAAAQLNREHPPQGMKRSRKST